MKKGFTLIELLAIIIILAIVALVATPIVLDVIDNSRDKLAMTEAQTIVESINNYCAGSAFNKQTQGTNDICSDGVDSEELKEMVKSYAEVVDVVYTDKVEYLVIKANGRNIVYNGYEYVKTDTTNIDTKYTVRRLLTSTDSAWERMDNNAGKTANATKDGSTITYKVPLELNDNCQK